LRALSPGPARRDDYLRVGSFGAIEEAYAVVVLVLVRLGYVLGMYVGRFLDVRHELWIQLHHAQSLYCPLCASTDLPGGMEMGDCDRVCWAVYRSLLGPR
jgi:hypothetical protein